MVVHSNGLAIGRTSTNKRHITRRWTERRYALAKDAPKNIGSQHTSVFVDRWAKHWITPLAFAPFALMLLVHRLLGLSDAMLGAPLPGNTFWPLYNIAMVVVFYGGVAGYLAHTFWMSDRGWGWVVLKCALLIIGWTAMILTLEVAA